MYRNLSILWLLLAIYLSGCKQEAYKIPAPAPASTYMPQTYGSTWTYRDSVFGESTDTVPIYGVQIDTATYTINGATTDYIGLVYYNVDIVSKLHGTSTAYYFVGGHNYQIIDDTPPMGQVVRRVLNDALGTGGTWVYGPELYVTYEGNPIQSISTIVSEDTTKVVAGQIFNHVIHTTANFQTDIKSTGYKNVAFINYYLAKGVGLIEEDASYYGCLNEKRTLLNYSVK